MPGHTALADITGERLRIKARLGEPLRNPDLKGSLMKRPEFGLSRRVVGYLSDGHERLAPLSVPSLPNAHGFVSRLLLVYAYRILKINSL